MNVSAIAKMDYELEGRVPVRDKLEQIEKVKMATWPVRLVLGLPGALFNERLTPIESLGQRIDLSEADKPIVMSSIQAWAKLINIDRGEAKRYVDIFQSLFEVEETADLTIHKNIYARHKKSIYVFSAFFL